MTKKYNYKNKKPDGKNATGRPKVEIDKGLFENLCNIQCTKEEICQVLEVDEKTITRFCLEEYGEQFKEVWKIKSAPGKASLRRWQFAAAKGGNSTLLVWLGKQYLGQTDKQDFNHEGGLNLGIEWIEKDEG